MTEKKGNSTENILTKKTKNFKNSQFSFTTPGKRKTAKFGDHHLDKSYCPHKFQQNIYSQLNEINSLQQRKFEKICLKALAKKEKFNQVCLGHFVDILAGERDAILSIQ